MKLKTNELKTNELKTNELKTSVYILFNSKTGPDTVFEFVFPFTAPTSTYIDTNSYRSCQVRACETILRVLTSQETCGSTTLHPRDYFISSDGCHESSEGYGNMIPLIDMEDIYDTSFSIHLLSELGLLQEHYEVVTVVDTGLNETEQEVEWIEQIDTYLTMYYRQKKWYTPRFFPMNF